VSVQVERRGPVAWLAFRGRRDLNLLGHGVLTALAEALDRLAGEPGLRAVVLTGAGERAFSAGADLEEMRRLDPTSAEAFIRAVHAVCDRLLRLPLPVVARIQGPCLGAGLELALACDLRIASEEAVLGLPEVRVGVPSVVEAYLLAPTVGLGRARRLLLTGEALPASQALAMGLVDAVAPGAGLDRAVESALAPFLSIHPRVLAVQKRVVAHWLEVGLSAGVEYSIREFALGFAHPDTYEAMDAFLEKRSPRFAL